MSVSHFTSETYSEHERYDAWQQRLDMLGLRSILKSVEQGRHANAVLRGTRDQIVVGRLAASAQTFGSGQLREGLPLLMIPLEDDVVVDADGHKSTISPGSLIILPRNRTWHLEFRRDVQGIVLSVATTAFGGRKIGGPEMGALRILPAEGFAGVLAHTLEATAQSLDALTQTEWSAVDQSLAEMLLTLVY